MGRRTATVGGGYCPLREGKEGQEGIEKGKVRKAGTVGGNHRPLWARRKQEGRFLPSALAPCALLEILKCRKHAKIKLALFPEKFTT